MSDGVTEKPNRGRETILRQQPELEGHKEGRWCDQCLGHCGGGGAGKHPLPQMLFKVEGKRENHPSFSPPPPFRFLPLSLLAELTRNPGKCSSL